MVLTESHWNAEQKLVSTRISGNADLSHVEKWETSLHQALDEIPDNAPFKFLVDLHGFKAVNFEVHKKFRVVIPQSLADYGWRVGYLDMFPEAHVRLHNRRGIRCVAAVHVHHDETKIKNYDTHYSKPNERFFTDPAVARKWIESIHIDNHSL